MKKILMWLRFALPFLSLAAEALEDLDADDTGIDDRAAVAIRYLNTIIMALVAGTEVPPAPDSLR